MHARWRTARWLPIAVAIVASGARASEIAPPADLPGATPEEMGMDSRVLTAMTNVLEVTKAPVLSLLIPAQEIVVTMTGIIEDIDENAFFDWLVREFIELAVVRDAPLPPDPGADALLSTHLARVRQQPTRLGAAAQPVSDTRCPTRGALKECQRRGWRGGGDRGTRSAGVVPASRTLTGRDRPWYRRPFFRRRRRAPNRGGPRSDRPRAGESCTHRAHRLPPQRPMGRAARPAPHAPWSSATLPHPALRRRPPPSGPRWRGRRGQRGG